MTACLLLFTLAGSVRFVGCCRAAVPCGWGVVVVVLVQLSDVSFHPSAVHKPLGTNMAPLD